MKVVINDKVGKFSLSEKALNKLNELGGNEYWDGYWDDYCIDPEYRSHPLLIQVVEELGEEANGEDARLKIVEIPDNTLFYINNFEGSEWIEEAHETWE